MEMFENWEFGFDLPTIIICVAFVAAHLLWVAISDEWTRWP